MSEREGSGGGSFGGFLLGLAVGAVVGFLFAPATGEDTRRKLSKRLKTLRDAAGDLLEVEEGDEAVEEPASTREQLRRRLQAARQRRRAAGGEDVEEGDEPVA